METNWKWGAEPKRKGSEGFNDAGILTFNSHAINSFVRELFQNSNDAKVKGEKKIKIKIERSAIAKSDIPQFDEYFAILQDVERSHPQHGKFFKKAYESLKSNVIECLIYSDYNTKGLSGTEDDNTSSFAACVLSEGISAKDNKTAGGSFGIGKSAIYGISNLRTVLFSSLTIDGEYIFQGVAKLASYKVDNLNHEGRVYLGIGNERLSIRERENIPQRFRRTEPGLSQFILGVAIDDAWKTDFTKAILRNYWMLLMDDGLEVELKDKNDSLIINSENLLSLMNSIFTNDDDEHNLQPYGNPLMFYDALLNGEKRIFDIPFIGDCSFSYIENEKGENNIAYLRNGMVVFTRIEKRLVGASITGVFNCLTVEGNEILRLMEPPKHDSFEPQMLEDKHESLNKKDGDSILNKTRWHIRLVIRGLIAKYKKETETPPFLVELFEDLEKSFEPSNKGRRQNEKTEIETLHKIANEDVLDIVLDSRSSGAVLNTTSGVTTDGISDSSRGDQPGIRKKESKRGKGKKGGSAKSGKSKNYAVQSRIFLFSESETERVYKAVLKTDTSLKSVELNLAQYADSGQDVAFILNQVKDEEGNLLPFQEFKDSDGLTSQYKLTSDIDKLKVLYLSISDNQRSAFILN